MEVRRPTLEVGAPAELRISLPLGVLTDSTVGQLKEILVEHPGTSRVMLHVGAKVLRLPAEFNVDGRNGLVGQLKKLLGANAIVA
jgi:DNA polymerase III subunit alpha